MVEGTEGGGPELGSGSKTGSSFESAGGRLRFTVDLRPGETTIVSWKKLLKEANSSKSDWSGPPISGPSYEAQTQPVSLSPPPPPPVAPSSSKQPMEKEPKDSQVQAGSNRLSTVIERIERIYAGNGSSDEEDVVLYDVPDDDEYDTGDSFIDDAELDDYFQVDNSAIKHDGFFINRGKLERTEPTISTNQQPKKRRRKDLTEVHGGRDDGDNPNKIVKIGNKGRKASSSIQRNSTSQSHSVALSNIHGEDMQFQASSANAPEVTTKKKTADIQITVDPSGLPKDSAIKLDMETGEQRPGVLSSKNHIGKWKKSELQDTSTQGSNDKSLHVSKSHSGKQLNNVDDLDQSIQQKEKGGLVETFDLNAPASRDGLPTTKAAITQRKEGSSVGPKFTTLEKAIRELEKIVAEFRPPSTEAPDPDSSSQAIKRRLTPEIKQKLAKVAGLAQASYGKIPEDVVNRLMTIVGHLMQIRTLKRNLKVMANMGLSAKEEKDDRIQKIKQEVAEMVKLRIPYMKSKIEEQAANSDDFQDAGPEEKGALKRKYGMDDVLENKICDLYDLYVERLEEYSGPPVRRLYEELVLLWPSGFMDTDGIKRAVYRAKDKRGLSSLRKDREKIKTKKVLAPKADDAINVSTLTSKPVTDATAVAHGAARLPLASTNCPNMDKPKQEKMNGSSGSSPMDLMSSNELPKKKVKRKPNAEVVEADFLFERPTNSHVEEQTKHHKHIAVPLNKSNLQQAVPSGTGYLS